MITRLTFDQISTAVHDAYEACKDIKGGQNAHYIPYLANVNSDLFGISLCLPDGRLISVGDTDYRFGIESVSKVHTAILALEQHGAQAILELCQSLLAQGKTVACCGMSENVRRYFDRAGITEVLGESAYFWSADQAILDLLDAEIAE